MINETPPQKTIHYQHTFFKTQKIMNKHEITNISTHIETPLS
jgi:hypothetical protein